MSTPHSAEPNPTDRRTATRIELEVEVGLETEHNFYTGLTQDISSGGLFVATNILYRVGEHVTVRFTLPDREKVITAETEVRWLRDPHTMRTELPAGIGLRFVELDEEVKNTIADFLKRRDSLYYDVD